MTYHLFVIRGRETKPRSLGRVNLEDSEPGRRKEWISVLREWAQDLIAEQEDRYIIRRWWVVRADTAEEGRELLERLTEVYRPDLPEIPADVRERVALLGR